MSLTITRALAREHSGLIETANRALDVIGLIVSAAIVYLANGIGEEQWRSWMLLALLNVVITIGILQQTGLYRSWRGRPFTDQFGRMLLAGLGAAAITALVWMMIGLDSVISSRFLMHWLGINVAMVTLQRSIFYWLIRRYRVTGANAKHVLIYGAGSLGRTIANQAALSPESGYQILGFIDDNEALHGTEINKIDVMGGIGSLDQILAQQAVDEIWVALPLSATHKVTDVMEVADKRMVAVRLFPDLYGLTLLNHSASEMLGFPIIDLSVDRMQGLNRLIKDLEDKILGFTFFLLALPLIGIIALAIKLTSEGPVIFRQKRNGWDGYQFTIYKFRTMVLHNEPKGQLTQASQNDHRFTFIGRWLRRTSLDELPQLFNVIQGKMSLVGPRPHAIEHDNLFQHRIEGYLRRNRVKPGITGWAQVNDFRGEVQSLEDMNRRVKHDLYYIEHWSLWFDLRIIIATILKVFFSKKAW